MLTITTFHGKVLPTYIIVRCSNAESTSHTCIVEKRVYTYNWGLYINKYVFMVKPTSYTYTYIIVELSIHENAEVYIYMLEAYLYLIWYVERINYM